MGCSPWSCKESGTTERLTLTQHKVAWTCFFEHTCEYFSSRKELLVKGYMHLTFSQILCDYSPKRFCQSYSHQRCKTKPSYFKTSLHFSHFSFVLLPKGKKRIAPAPVHCPKPLGRDRSWLLPASCLESVRGTGVHM